jgi:hypothetical protein
VNLNWVRLVHRNCSRSHRWSGDSETWIFLPPRFGAVQVYYSIRLIIFFLDICLNLNVSKHNIASRYI